MLEANQNGYEDDFGMILYVNVIQGDGPFDTQFLAYNMFGIWVGCGKKLAGCSCFFWLISILQWLRQKV